jgi:mono/diheme cytochrome c family protein
MARQPRYDAFKPAVLFRDGKTMQAPPAGTLAAEDAPLQAAERTPPPMTPVLIARGRERYDIFCSPCHDRAGYGEGIVVARGFPRPASFHTPAQRALSDRQIFDAIGQGSGMMYGFADRVGPQDRWAIVAYIRSLQMSQAAPVASLNTDERARVDDGR